MLHHPDHALLMHKTDHAELVHAAEQDRYAIGLLKARRMELWAQYATRISAHLTRNAQVQRARWS